LPLSFSSDARSLEFPVQLHEIATRSCKSTFTTKTSVEIEDEQEITMKLVQALASAGVVAVTTLGLYTGPSIAAEQLYSFIDENGTAHFSNVPADARYHKMSDQPSATLQPDMSPLPPDDRVQTDQDERPQIAPDRGPPTPAEEVDNARVDR
jgi:Domain of unknown function (DUF4124)